MLHFPVKSNPAGSINGYMFGGEDGSLTPSAATEKYVFASEGSSVSIAATLLHFFMAGYSHTTNGYLMNGAAPDLSTFFSNICKFTFNTEVVSASIANTTAGRTSASAFSTGIGAYTAGGINSYNASTGAEGMVNTIDKFLFATEANTTQIGTLTENKSHGGKFNTYTYGYFYGGVTQSAPITTTSRLEKFYFALDGSSVNIATVSSAQWSEKGSSSPIGGYIYGYSSDATSVTSSNIFKFLFATETSYVQIGSQATGGVFSSSAWTLYNSFQFGGFLGGSTDTNAIQKFGYASDGNSVNVGTLAGGAKDSFGEMNY